MTAARVRHLGRALWVLSPTLAGPWGRSDGQGSAGLRARGAGREGWRRVTAARCVPGCDSDGALTQPGGLGLGAQGRRPRARRGQPSRVEEGRSQ